MNLKLSTSGIEKTYADKRVLRGCAHLFSNGVTAIMGPNGCGKSTLLRICALLEPPSSGGVRYYYDNRAVPQDISLMRKITLVLPRAGIFSTSVWDNAAYGLKIRGLRQGEIKERTAGILNAVGLYDKRRQNALTISSGESQRLALARAMVLEPEVLFLDEPTASVDEENTAIIEELILGMKRPGGPMVVMATHDRAQAERLAESVVMMQEGRIVKP